MNRKVLVFSHEFPPMQGGEGTYAFELSMGLKKLGYDISILAGTPFSDGVSADSVDVALSEIGIRVYRHDWVNRERLWFVRWRRRLKNHLEKYGPFDFLFLANFTSCVVAQHFRPEELPPYSITLHGDDIDYFFTRNKWKSYILIRQTLARRLFEDARKLICVSDYTRRKLLKVVPFSLEPTVIHHGMETPDVDSISKKGTTLHKDLIRQRCLKPDVVIIVYVSRLEPSKGHDLLLQCLSNDDELKKKTHTVFVGGGSRLQELKRMASEKGLADQVTFTGYVPRDEVMQYLSFCDFSVFLSCHPFETFGLVLLEAMAMGKPVVALRHGGMVEFVADGKCGFLVDESDVSDKLRRLVSDVELRDNMGMAGRNLVEKHYNNRAMAVQTVEGLWD